MRVSSLWVESFLGFGPQVSGLRFLVSDFGFRVSGFGGGGKHKRATREMDESGAFIS